MVKLSVGLYVHTLKKNFLLHRKKEHLFNENVTGNAGVKIPWAFAFVKFIHILRIFIMKAVLTN